MQTNEDAKPASTRPAPPGPEAGSAAPEATPRARAKRHLRVNETWVPAFAVGVVALAGLTAAFMSAPPDAPEPAAQLADSASTAQKGVVKAPPLKVPTVATAQERELGAWADAARSMGSASACRNCGVVQMVVAVHGYAQPRASGYQMHIRMDDGSTRMVEQRGALAAGSRVLVERDSVRLLAERANQG